MKKEYDFIFLTNTPSFYKLNLCNEIAKTHSMLLVLYGYGSEAVNENLSDKKENHFDFCFINDGDANTRNKFVTFKNLLRLMQKVRGRKILYAGWLAPEYNLYAFLSPKEKNVVISESSFWDVSLNGIKGFIKKRFIDRMSAALPSGTPHKQLFENVGFVGEVQLTGGVGIFRKVKRNFTQNCNRNFLRYIYVGRLIHVKNVEYLIDVFNYNGKALTIVGAGKLETLLRERAKANITFQGFVDNELLGELYCSHDVFILPSISETWGLVVDESLYWGLPVIVSSRVGAGIDLVSKNDAGVIFDIEDADGLPKAIDKMELNYDYYRQRVELIDFEERDRLQVKAYTDLLKK